MRDWLAAKANTSVAAVIVPTASKHQIELNCSPLRHAGWLPDSPRWRRREELSP